ncbi:MAG TPA: hypothetical protein VFL36_20315 [Myxococcales bacterium]|nr:hypothetical protein [Myxococcales bacterium]
MTGPAPTDGVRALAAAALASRLAAGALRWAAACACGFAGLLLLALGLAAFDRSGAGPAAETSAAAYLDFDLAVLRAAADRGLAGTDQAALLRLWARRPDWELPAAPGEGLRLASLRDAWAAASSDKSRFRTAARGAADALPFVVGGLGLSLLAAAAGGALARLRNAGTGGRLAFAAGCYALVVHPLWALLDPALFYDRTRSAGAGLGAALFVAAFAGTLSAVAARALFGPARFARSGGHPAFGRAARVAALEAADWLVPMVPALAGAALFVCARADQDPRVQGSSSGLGALIRAALGEAAAGERLSSCALVAGAVVLLWFAGHRFVLEMRNALGAARFAP